MRIGDDDPLTLLKQLDTQIHLELPHVNSPTTDCTYTPRSPFSDEFYEYVNSKGMICGPMDISRTSTHIVSHFQSHSMVEPYIWLRPCLRKARWYKINVNYLNIKTKDGKSIALCKDTTFYTVCGNLANAIEKLKKVSLCCATGYPKKYIDEANGECSLFLHLITMIINYSLFLFGLLHVHILIYFFCLLQYSAFIHKNAKLLVLICMILTLMAIVTSFTVAYSFIYFGFYDGFQSWMVAYISWISIQWIDEAFIRILHAFGYFKIVFGYDSFRLNLLGIKFRRKNDLILASGYFNCWINPTFSLLPASIIGFVYDYIMEPKFVLHCDADMTVGDVCYDDHSARTGCCDVVSSHDNISDHFDSIFDFLGGLTSSIIGVYAIICVLSWFMVSNTRQYRGMFQKAT